MTQWGLDTLFNPAKRHMDEEKRRLQATRQEVGDASGGKRIDLESGKVRIGKPHHDEDEDEPTDSEGSADGGSADAGSVDGGSVDGGSVDGGVAPKGAEPEKDANKPAPSPAAIRAARRRGRQPR
jgi:hypothetical protein